MAHRDSPQDGCPSAALLAEVGRCSHETKRAYTKGLLAIVDEIAGRLAPDDPLSTQEGIKNALALIDSDTPA